MYTAIKLFSLLLFWHFLCSDFQFFKTLAKEEELTSHAKLSDLIRENGGTVSLKG
jgi:hypothetical protein